MSCLSHIIQGDHRVTNDEQVHQSTCFITNFTEGGENALHRPLGYSAETVRTEEIIKKIIDNFPSLMRLKVLAAYSCIPAFGQVLLSCIIFLHFLGARISRNLPYPSTHQIQILLLL
jgi:hypothetical protein